MITVAVTKTALMVCDSFVQLQRANGAEVLSMASATDTGVQQFVHAAAVVLQRKQTERIRSAGFLSTMGDGSNDRRTTEQEIIYVRYATTRKPISESLSGLRFRVEFFDLVPVDVTFSADQKSFDARAILRSTYHTAFLERGLASLPQPVAPPAPAAQPPTAEDAPVSPRAQRAQRRIAAAPAAAAAPAPAPAANPVAEPTLKTHDLTIGSGARSRRTSSAAQGSSTGLALR